MSTSEAQTNPATIADLVSLAGRSAIVTGAGGRGFSFAIAQRIAEAGANLRIVDIDGAAARSAADELQGGPGTVHGEALDVRDVAAVDRFVAATAADLDGIDILVNSAGVYPATPLDDLSLDDWQRTYDTNVTGVLHLVRAVAPHMQAAGRGVIVNVTSTSAIRPQSPGMAAYVSSKHALDGLTKALALELGPSGIRVVAVAPSMSLTPGVLELLGAAGTADVSAVVEHLTANTPLRRLVLPDEVARAVLFAASDLASYVTGSTIVVDGGAMTL